ncbi:MAG TPA: alpha-ketoglutarate-dependent dioxygenase AlkB, partial [Chryseosolibacter sp.]|nr:alpha-ketoglutarate-dependent dioxygenase AlkB [Chryseosolibacter sp.]
DSPYPKGFLYRPDFLDRDEESVLVDIIRKIHLRPFQFQGFEARRKVISFGYDYSFDKNELTEGKPIPDDFAPLIEKVSRTVSVGKDEFREVLVTEYPPGAVINWHRDASPFDLIAGISLAADCTFKLRPYNKSKQTRGSVISIPLQRRSLYVITASARTDWQHSISPVKSTRFSITLRTLRQNFK